MYDIILSGPVKAIEYQSMAQDGIGHLGALPIWLEKLNVGDRQSKVWKLLA